MIHKKRPEFWNLELHNEFGILELWVEFRNLELRKGFLESTDPEQAEICQFYLPGFLESDSEKQGYKNRKPSGL